jgi:hypothetical protein
MSYVTTRDIVIPAGTEVDISPAGMGRTIHCDFASILTAETKDHTSEWSMPLDEALELGIVAPKEALAA